LIFTLALHATHAGAASEEVSAAVVARATASQGSRHSPRRRVRALGAVLDLESNSQAPGPLSVVAG